MLYKNEFGSNFDLGFNLSDHPYLNDKSWHNDVSPSFYFNAGAQYYVLWVDYADPNEREYSNERYLIQQAENEGDAENPEAYSAGSIVFKSEVFEGARDFLKNLTPQLN